MNAPQRMQRAAEAAPEEAQQRGAVLRPPPVPSEALLQGRRLLEIAHNGDIYRLQTTRQGKLILTK